MVRCAVVHWDMSTLRASYLGGPDHLREELDPSHTMRPEPCYADEMGYMHTLERGFAEHVRRPICLSYLQFFSKLLDTGRSDRQFPTSLNRGKSYNSSSWPRVTSKVIHRYKASHLFVVQSQDCRALVTQSHARFIS
jgi:hypothetical protein